ncbi:MAG: hypothetical protein N2747_11680, partial [Chitinophagaceae bacterium]|nr:hypothetical protein [Chitinophagaceae bacterium]
KGKKPLKAFFLSLLKNCTYLLNTAIKTLLIYMLFETSVHLTHFSILAADTYQLLMLKLRFSSFKGKVVSKEKTERHKTERRGNEGKRL